MYISTRVTNCDAKSCILQTCLTTRHFVDLILGLSHEFAASGRTLVGIVLTSNIQIVH
jgi:hypothetical protein